MRAHLASFLHVLPSRERSRPFSPTQALGLHVLGKQGLFPGCPSLECRASWENKGFQGCKGQGRHRTPLGGQGALGSMVSAWALQRWEGGGGKEEMRELERQSGRQPSVSGWLRNLGHSSSILGTKNLLGMQNPRAQADPLKRNLHFPRSPRKCVSSGCVCSG